MDATFLDYFDMYSYYSAYCPYYQVIKLPLIYEYRGKECQPDCLE